MFLCVSFGVKNINIKGFINGYIVALFRPKTSPFLFGPCQNSPLTFFEVCFQDILQITRHMGLSLLVRGNKRQTDGIMRPNKTLSAIEACGEPIDKL